MAQEEQLELADWPGAQIRKKQHGIIRFDYEQLLTHCARLASFAASEPVYWGSPVSKRQDELAAADLVSFAIHARRLMNNTFQPKRFSHVCVPAVLKDTRTQVPIRSVINAIVHHDSLQVVRTKFEIMLLANMLSVEDIVDFHKLKTPISPTAIIEWDKGRMIILRLRDLAGLFETGVLDPIIDLCTEQGLYLDLDEA